MAKITPRRRSALDNPEEVLTLAQRLLERLKPHARWLVLAGVVIAVGLGAWGGEGQDAGKPEGEGRRGPGPAGPQGGPQGPGRRHGQGFGEVRQGICRHPGGPGSPTPAGQPSLPAAQYTEAAKAYESLLDGRDPGWDTLVNESLSYCYEGMGNFKKAAAVLKPVAEQTSGPLKSEVMRRLAMLYEQAQGTQRSRGLLAQTAGAAAGPRPGAVSPGKTGRRGGRRQEIAQPIKIFGQASIQEAEGEGGGIAYKQYEKFPVPPKQLFRGLYFFSSASLALTRLRFSSTRGARSWSP